MKPQRLVLHPCLCGFRATSYAQFRKHRRACGQWRDRPNPRGLSIYRRAKSQPKARVGVPSAEDLMANPAFYRYLEWYNIDPRVFSIFLRLLTLRLKGKWG